ncbi:hypothetical protein NE237_007420 [Protea cynaroides]|uniref:Uncharacterized protein n=1 Tax=Protea cynaroides TaxID=273540 RepID=A0A9Q0KPE7_9MAGN|nr:hypothetical protein NE237_007420 [Protea cynaroides]
METEAEIPEPIPSNKIGAKDKESICGESESSTALQKVEIELGLPTKIVEVLTKTEHLEVETNVNNDIVNCVIKGDVGTCEGESFFVSPSLAKVPIENICRASENTVVDEKMILQQEIQDNETQLQKDLIQKAIEEKYDITVAENYNTPVKQGPADTGLENDGEPLPNVDEGKETEKEKDTLGQEVEIMDKQASNKELKHNVEKVKALNHAQEDVLEGKKSSEEPELELEEHVHETSRAIPDQNQEALPFTLDSTGENLKKTDVRDIIDTRNKEASTDTAPPKQDVEETSIEGVTLNRQEKSSITGVMETGPNVANPNENTGESKQEGKKYPEDNSTDSVSKAEECSNIQNGEENINNNEGTNEVFHIPPNKFMTEETSSDKSEQKIGNIEQSSKITVDSNEKLNGENPGENENPDGNVEIPLHTEETRSDKSEQEAGKLEETFSTDLEEKSQETIDSKEEMKDEKPFEYELQDSEDLKSPLVTLATEGSHFQEQDEPEKTEETSETESVNIGKDKSNEAKPQYKILETAESTIREKAKDDENTETKLDASSIKDGEGPERESKKLVLPLTNASVEENDDKKGSSVIEPTDNIGVTEIIEAEEICKWEIPKDAETSLQSFQTDETEEEKLEKSLDVVSKAVEPAALNAEAQRSTSEKVEEVSNLEVEEQVHEENRDAPVENNNIEEEIRARENMESTILEQGKTRDGAQTLELISLVSGIKVEEIVKVCKLDSKEKSTETDASHKIEEQTEKNEGEVQKTIIEEDSPIPDQEASFSRNQIVDQNGEVKEKKEAPEFNGEEQNCKTNDADKATKNEITDKEVSAELKMAAAGEDTEKDIIKESTDTTQFTESLKEPLKESSQESKIVKKNEEKVHKGTDTDCEVPEKSITGENMERQKVAENSTVKNHPAPSIQQETVIESCQEDEMSKGLETTGVGRETERAILEEYGAVTDTYILSVVGAAIKESSEEDKKAAEKLKEEVKFTVSDVGTLKNTEDTNKSADASGVTEVTREEMLQKEQNNKFAVSEEQIKEKDHKEAENNNERFEVASARTSQDAEQEGEQLVEDSNLSSEEDSPITTETSWTSLQYVHVKGEKLEGTPNPSANETEKTKEILVQEIVMMDKQASNKELSHDVDEVKTLNHSQEDETEGKKSRKEPELELGEHVHETSRATTDQNQEALPFTPDLIGENLKIDDIDIIEVCIRDASTDSTPTKQDGEKSGFEGVTLKGQEKSSITGGTETGPTIVNPSEKTGEKKQEGEENPEDNNTDSVSKAEEGSKIQNDEEIINNSEGTNEMFHIPSTKFMIKDTSSDKSEQKTGNVEISNIETVHSNESLNGENENPDDDDEDIPLVTEETRPDKSEQEVAELAETSSSEWEEKSQETIYLNEKMKDEKPVEYELPDTEDLESHPVTLAKEGSHFQEQYKPGKIEETSETESVNIGCNEAEPQDIILETGKSTTSKKAKDDENPETKLDASSHKDEEGLLQRESEKLELTLTNASIVESEDKKGSSVIETRDNIEVTEIIEVEENRKWEIPKDVEISEESLQKDKTVLEKLEKFLDVVFELDEPAISNAGAERSTSEKEEDSIKRVEENFNEGGKDGNINWVDEARGHRRRKDENHRAVDQSQKTETMEFESPNMVMGSFLVAHSLAEGTIQEECEQKEEVSNLEVEEQVHEENRNTPVEDNHIEEEFRTRENMDSTIMEQGKTRDGAQTLELISHSQVSGMEVEETVKVCKLDSQEKSPETDASPKIEEQTKKNEETSKIVMGKTLTEGEVEKMIIEEDSCIPDQGTVFFGNQAEDQNSVEEKKEAPEFNGEKQDCKTNDMDKATKKEIINKEVSAESKTAGVDEDNEKHIIKESPDMTYPTESMKEPPKESSQEGEFMKKQEEKPTMSNSSVIKVHKELETECEVLEKSRIGENTERQNIAENSGLKDHPTPSIEEETVIERSQEDEVFVSQRFETTDISGETERPILEEYEVVTDTCILSVVGTIVKESSEEDEKEAEKLKEEVKFTISEVGTLKNMEDTNKNTDTPGVTKATREEMLPKVQSQKFAVYEETIKEKDLEEAENNNERFEVASARTTQEAEQEVEQLVDGSNLDSEEKSAITTETSWTSLQHVYVKGVKLEETHNPSENETEKKKEILGQEFETVDRQASHKELSHDVDDVKTQNHSQEVETEGKKSSEEPELEPGEKVHETRRATTDQNQEALPFTPDLIGENLKIDDTDIIEVCIRDASTDGAPTKRDVKKSDFEGVTLKGQEKFSITGDTEIVNPSEKTGEKKQEGKENPEDNNTDSVSKAEEGSKIQNDEEIINNSEGTNEMFHIPSTKFMIEDTISDKSEQKIGNVEISNIETVHSNEAWNGENENPDDDVDIPLVAEETGPYKSEQEAGKLEENFSSELEEKSQETIDSKEEMTDEKPVENELQDSEYLKSPLVTLATEGSYFQEQDEPEKTEDTSETESANIGKDKCNEAKPQDKILETAERTISEKAKDDENTETKLYVSSIKDGEGLERESKKLLLPLTNASIEENDDKKGSSVIEPTENIEVTEIIEAEENCIWEIPKDVEASIQSFPTDEPEEEKLEKSLDVVPEAVEPATSHAEAQRSTSEKEEKSIKTIEENFNEESKEGKINWDDEGRGQGRQKDENPTEVDQSQKIDTMEIENPNMETGSVLVAHSLSRGTIQEACEQQEEVSNIELEEQVHEENRTAPVEDNNIEETQKKKEILGQEFETVDRQASHKELSHDVDDVKTQNHSQEVETEGKKSSEEPELEPGEKVHETRRATTDQNQEALPFTPDLIGENLKIDDTDIIEVCIRDASTDGAPTKRDVKKSDFEGVTLKGQEKFSITGDTEIVNPSEKTGKRNKRGKKTLKITILTLSQRPRRVQRSKTMKRS